MQRRDFVKTLGVLAAGMPLIQSEVLLSSSVKAAQKQNHIPTVYGAFVYPPTAKLDKEGYYSWPGTGFDAEGRQRQYMKRIQAMATKLGMHIQMEEKPVDTDSDVTQFIQKVKKNNPDGLLLIPFKKGHWDQVIRIIDETAIPSVILATLGILLAPHIRQAKYRSGVYLINSLDNLDAAENGMKMFQTMHRMNNSIIINITGEETMEHKVPIIDTTVRTIPHQRFYSLFKETKATSEVKELANTYIKNAVRMVEPGQEDVVEAAKTYFVFKKLIKEEQADAVMMNCLPGLKYPHQHVPPCMGYMSLRDQGIPMGCESDLDATLTMMLEQNLFNRPGFQHNPTADTEKNHYFCAHCTAPSKMNGLEGPSAPFIMRSHAEAGWGVVPRVLMERDQEVTIAKYLSSKQGEKPQLLLYS
jgi:hypothetical protein